ncbi:hypothetical protein RFI_02656 [Reticulomyxa filosa]|uniref:Uncharacterized protein n=1 Tax=Reticulomyxa filosa TaxID=46433 RepID=X6P8K2_RETFI|nr:hypothetical protein RFI_02656 [Reticulomyxa filosa]|eukprot:ETO34438.1 hypothetical protein RFI_02656 [Reticulomyxa filosa]
MEPMNNVDMQEAVDNVNMIERYDGLEHQEIDYVDMHEVDIDVIISEVIDKDVVMEDVIEDNVNMIEAKEAAQDVEMKDIEVVIDMIDLNSSYNDVTMKEIKSIPTYNQLQYQLHWQSLQNRRQQQFPIQPQNRSNHRELEGMNNQNLLKCFCKMFLYKLIWITYIVVFIKTIDIHFDWPEFPVQTDAQTEKKRIEKKKTVSNTSRCRGNIILFPEVPQIASIEKREKNIKIIQRMYF